MMLAKLGELNPSGTYSAVFWKYDRVTPQELRDLGKAMMEKELRYNHMWGSGLIDKYAELALTEPKYLEHVEAVINTWFYDDVMLGSTLRYISGSIRRLDPVANAKIVKLIRSKLPKRLPAQVARDFALLKKA